VVLKGDDSALDLAIKQLRKLVNVVSVTDFKEGEAVLRELVLAKIKADAQTRAEIIQICDIFRAKIVNVASDEVIVEMTGNKNKVLAFLGLIEPFGIRELARTGQLALTR
jgi:acetolactate synthase-1/3 small subunit